MCQFRLMQDDDEDEGGAAAGPIAKPVKPSRNYGGPFRKTPGRLLGMGFIRLYQLTLSSLIGNSCRHLPTCSEYGYEAIARHGFWSGGWMTLFRVARCGPGGSSGFDPVPETLEPTTRWWAPWRHWSRRTA
ncbi:membrane protein insertion efficiency factor YidD [Rhizobium sp. YJ-22]|uniref:membrane protein insertion efficiency factor YidD n=1 Tax=Rhizobium sp. YJ-22 TaxID=3037556 RepID=UPI0024127084|nr:membrane protein insertion efficiency factor YidD [Rhizobium sp. YJ-22]MDG3578692.1 membrane protein insertion efficiency factor YidD [Rhizobium sp. YJ-22]